MNKLEEILVILQEEAAEVIQAASKCRRFGFDNLIPNSSQTNSGRLEAEIGDLCAMIDLLSDLGHICPAKIERKKREKIEKLKFYSNIFN